MKTLPLLLAFAVILISSNQEKASHGKTDSFITIEQFQP